MNKARDEIHEILMEVNRGRLAVSQAFEQIIEKVSELEQENKRLIDLVDKRTGEGLELCEQNSALLASIKKFSEYNEVSKKYFRGVISMKERNRCIIFLEQNGWKVLIDNTISDCTSYFKDGCLSIDISEDELIFIGEAGDFLNTPILYYALLGVLMEYRQIPCNYVSVPNS